MSLGGVFKRVFVTSLLSGGKTADEKRAIKKIQKYFKEREISVYNP